MFLPHSFFLIFLYKISRPTFMSVSRIVLGAEGLPKANIFWTKSVSGQIIFRTPCYKNVDHFYPPLVKFSKKRKWVIVSPIHQFMYTTCVEQTLYMPLWENQSFSDQSISCSPPYYWSHLFIHFSDGCNFTGFLDKSDSCNRTSAKLSTALHA